MTHEDAIAAIDNAFGRDIDTLETVFTTGLVTGEKLKDLIDRYDRGYAIAVEAKDKMLAEADAYFSNQKK